MKRKSTFPFLFRKREGQGEDGLGPFCCRRQAGATTGNPKDRFPELFLHFFLKMKQWPTRQRRGSRQWRQPSNKSRHGNHVMKHASEEVNERRSALRRASIMFVLWMLLTLLQKWLTRLRNYRRDAKKNDPPPSAVDHSIAAMLMVFFQRILEVAKWFRDAKPWKAI